jgi:dGTPase
MGQPPEIPADSVSLWSTSRKGGSTGSAASPRRTPTSDVRTPFEHDYDRLLFSTPVRRMADKTQVFPLDRNDSVRTRLTHSHEVSNLARSIGNRLVRCRPSIFGSPEADQAAPVILASAGLAHDLGNPPFGHQGEVAIRRWFQRRAKEVFQPAEGDAVAEELQQDFLNFEGNAHTIRLVTRLQVSVGGYGLDLTAATLAALMKYTIPASLVGAGGNATRPSTKKPGFFASEASIVEWIRCETGLAEGQRHPLAWLMEACDDIAYRVLDIEDAMKKSIVSPEDVLAYLRRTLKEPAGKQLFGVLEADFAKADQRERVSEGSEIKAGYLRARLIEALMTGAADAFVMARDAIFAHSHGVELLRADPQRSEIYSGLKEFAATHAYNHPAVLRAELQGAGAISKLLDWLWLAVVSREDVNNLGSRRTSAFGSYAYAMISDNYRSELELRTADSGLPVRYHELQLLTDMVSGMTDGFVMELFRDLEPLFHA